MTTAVRAGALSLLLPRRNALTAAGAGLVLALCVAISVVLGTASLRPLDALRALAGDGTPGAVLLAQEFRLPRIVAGLLAGTALGAAGCLTQALARNRLATPDLTGVNEGATVAVLLSVLGSSSGMLGAWWAGPAGAVAAALLVVLAAGGIGTRGHRILVVGIGVSTVLSSIAELVMSQRELTHAAAVYSWTIGDLTGRGYPVAVPVALVLALVLPLALAAGRQLALLRLDDDVAATLGMNVRAARLGTLVVAVLLAGAAVGVGGPIGFVALAAPVVAVRLAGPERVPVVGSALIGAALVVAADTLGRLAGGSAELPVGVVTSVLGGPFLLWVLLSDRSPKE